MAGSYIPALCRPCLALCRRPSFVSLPRPFTHLDLPTKFLSTHLSDTLNLSYVNSSPFLSVLLSCTNVLTSSQLEFWSLTHVFHFKRFSMFSLYSIAFLSCSPSLTFYLPLPIRILIHMTLSFFSTINFSLVSISFHSARPSFATSLLLALAGWFSLSRASHSPPIDSHKPSDHHQASLSTANSSDALHTLAGPLPPPLQRVINENK